MSSCTELDCGGSIAVDGYCDTCGMAASSSSRDVSVGSVSIAAPQAVGGSGRSENAGTPNIDRDSVRRAGSSQRIGPVSTTTRRGVGAGLVSVDPTPVGNPDAALMSEEQVRAVLGEVPEDERFCSSCGSPVGRSGGGHPGRVKGFCGACRTRFDFVTNEPSLEPGELVAGQYEILGPLAHGGMGWIYLGSDRAVSGRWVVLKGLLNQSDPDAAAAAVAERKFLAEIEHSNIVNIYNFVTHRSAGYIVMEMVGGESLNSKLKRGGQETARGSHPLPVTDAVAYVLAVLPAFAYLHDHGLVYNDLKPANIMAVGSDVKLIDVGAVMKATDTEAAIFGTFGFQAPEMANIGPSVASDIYTIGRTLAVLVISFVFHTGDYLYSLPSREDEPLFAQWESLHRFLLKACAYHPDDRFQTVDAMGVQLSGVLREVAAVVDRHQVPSVSSFFDGDRTSMLLASGAGFSATQLDWRVLPRPKVDDSDPAKVLIERLPQDDPSMAVSLIEDALESGRAQHTAELACHHAWELIRANRSPLGVLTQMEALDPWDWRLHWYRAIWAMVDGRPVDAAELFGVVWTELPGEIAPRLGVAIAAETAGEYQRAAELYSRVLDIDSSFDSAAFGLARCQSEAGNREGVVEAYGRIPVSSVAHHEAQLAVARALLGNADDSAAVSETDLVRAASAIERLSLDAAQRALLAVDVFEHAIAGLRQGTVVPNSMSVLGHRVNEVSLLKAIEQSYRTRARMATTDSDRIRLVDLANHYRPRTLL